MDLEHVIQMRSRNYQVVTAQVVTAMTVALLLHGCAGGETKSAYPDTIGRGGFYSDERPVSIFGPGGLSIFGGENNTLGAGTPIPVNSFLWRASLDTLSFMPLISADPFGGVIITDWFTPPESANERFKMTVYILSRTLRSDGLKVAVFRQIRDDSGEWIDGEVGVGTARRLEDGILARARELRIAGLID